MPRIIDKKIKESISATSLKNQPTLDKFFCPKPFVAVAAVENAASSYENITSLISNVQQEQQPPAKRLKKDTVIEGSSTLSLEEVQVRINKISESHTLIDPMMGHSWFLALESQFDKPYFKELDDFVNRARKSNVVYPPHHHVWEWTKHTPINLVKVVILGQDPYHGPNQAHGLSFSVLKVKPPPSLVNIYKELESDIPGFVTPSHGCLLGWAQQGVLMLNACLTVNAGKPNSHKDKGWEKISDAVIMWISQNLNSVVFLLWGNDAKRKGEIVNKKKHHLLTSPHPSPFSARHGFFGSKHFSKCNAYLESVGKEKIDWSHLPAPSI